MGLFGKKKEEEKANTKTAKERIVFERLKDDDARAAELVDMLKDGNPLVLNFQDLDPPANNKLLAFFTGACYALDGKTLNVKEASYLFAKREDFIDGSLQEFLIQVAKK